MGVTESTLPDTEIQSQAVLAEAFIKNAVSTYATIVTAGGDNKVFLESAAIAQICALLCPGMPNRIKTSETSESGYAYKLESTDWTVKKKEFEGLIKNYTYFATGETYDMRSPLGVVTNDRPEI